MKKQILTAILAFAIVPSFAAHPTNIELLAHLKTVKEEIELLKLEAMSQSVDAYQEYGRENYFFLLNIDRQLGHSLKKKIFGDFDFIVNLLCNDMKTVADIDDIITARFEKFVATNYLTKDTLIPFLLNSGIEWLYELSKKIDIKIAELETQL